VIPCAKCRARKETELELFELKKRHRSLERKLTHRTDKISDLEDTISKQRKIVHECRRTSKRLRERYDQILDSRNDLREVLKKVKRSARKHLEEIDQ
jgi:uncharacterized coiled-coil protein SlyX